MTEQSKLFSSFGILKWKMPNILTRGRRVRASGIKARLTFSKTECGWTVICYLKSCWTCPEHTKLPASRRTICLLFNDFDSMRFSNVCAEFLRVLQTQAKKSHGLHLEQQIIFHVLITFSEASPRYIVAGWCPSSLSSQVLLLLWNSNPLNVFSSGLPDSVT